MNFEKYADGFDVEPVVRQIEANPHLWNAHNLRTTEGSPHYGIPDIWVRFRPQSELVLPHHYAEPHLSEFYPAWSVLTALHPILDRMIGIVRPYHVGGILITKIPAGKEVKWHHDRGGWHAEYHDHKTFLVLQGNDQCVNRFEDQEVVMHAGEAWRINNQVFHGVVNNGPTDRITAIFCMRTI